MTGDLDDQGRPLPTAQAAAATMPDARVETLTAAGHLGPLLVDAESHRPHGRRVLESATINLYGCKSNTHVRKHFHAKGVAGSVWQSAGGAHREPG